MRRRPAPPPPDDGIVPAYLRRFDPRDSRWSDPSDFGPFDEDMYMMARLNPHSITRAHCEATHRWVNRRGRWRAAQTAWATAHGFDLDARYGEKLGHDWWAFLQLVASTGDGA